MARWIVVWMCFAGAALAGNRCARAAESNWFDAIKPASQEQGQKPVRVTSSSPAEGQRELSDTPIAPLPPGILVGPIGLAAAGWVAHRVKKRRGVI